MTDFLEEVEEQLRSDRYRTLARKVLPWVLAVVAVLVIGGLGLWGWDRYRDQAVSNASEQYAAAMEAFSQGDEAQAVELWTQVSTSPAKGYAALALMQLGGLQLTDDKPAEAGRLFDQAAEAAPDEIIGDVARLKSAFALLDTSPYAELEARLKPLTEEGRPYRFHAREALAFAKIMAGEVESARGDFVVISQSLDAPEGARSRARAAIELIDSGSAKAVPNVVKSAASLPPPEQASAQTQPQAPGPQ